MNAHAGLKCARVGVRRVLRVEDSEAKLGVVVLAALEKPERIVGSLLGPCDAILGEPCMPGMGPQSHAPSSFGTRHGGGCVG